MTSLGQRADAAGSPARTARLVFIDSCRSSSPPWRSPRPVALRRLRLDDGRRHRRAGLRQLHRGFNIIFGSTGQLFLCVGALAGLGGFGSATLADQAGLPMLLAIPAGAAMAALVAGLLSWVAVRRDLGTIFIGVVTLAASLSYENLLLGLRSLTGGETGTFVESGSDTILRERVPSYFVFLAVLVVGPRDLPGDPAVAPRLGVPGPARRRARGRAVGCRRRAGEGHRRRARRRDAGTRRARCTRTAGAASSGRRPTPSERSTSGSS